MLPHRFKKTRLSQLFAAGIIAGLGSSALAGDFVLQSNQITWVSNGTLTNTSTATIADTGVAETINLLRGNDASALPNVSFTLEDLADTTGTYYIRLFMQVANQSSSNQVEMRLGVVEVAVNAGEITSAQMITNQADPNYAPVHVYARKSSGGATLNLDAQFATIAGMVTGSGDEVTVNVNNVVNALSGNNNLFDDIIERFASAGTFDYIIGINDDSANNGRIGTNDDGTFTVSPVAAPNFDLNPGFGAEFANATYIKGTLEIVNALPAPPSTGGGTTDPDPDDGEVVDQEEIEELDDQIENLDNTVTDELNNGQISDQTVNLTDDATNTAQGQAETVVNQLNNGNTVSTDNLLNVLTTTTKVADTGSTVVSVGGSNTIALVTKTNTLVNTTTQMLEQLSTKTASGNTSLSPTQQQVVQVSTNNLFNSTTRLSGVTSNIQEVSNLANTVTRIVNANTNMNIPIDETGLNNVISTLQKNAAKNLIGGTDQPDDTVISTLLQDPVQGTKLLDATPDTSRLNQPPLNTVRQQVQNNITLPDNVSTELADSIIQTNAANLQLTQSITNQASPGTIAGGLANSITGNSGNGSASVDNATGNLTITLNNLDFVGQPRSLKRVPASTPDTTLTKSDGSVTVISQGNAVTLVPTPIDPVKFRTAVNDLGFPETTQSDNGGITVNLGGNNQFSGTFAFDTVTPVTTTTNPPATTQLIAPTGNPTSPDYTYKVNYPNGTSQNIQPMVSNNNVFNSLDGLGLDVRTNRSTGVMNVGGTSVRPDYFVQPLSDSDRDFLNSNADASGVAYRQVDANNDGVTDYEVISAKGVQIVYGVP